MASTTVPISAFVICKNEVEFIADCLDSLDICAEIVVVDSGSNDGTLDLIERYRAKGLPIRLIHNDWPGFAKQKQFALDQCTQSWCLNLDSDERLDPALRTFLLGGAYDRSDIAGWSIPRSEFLPGFGYPPASVHAKPHIRLVRKDRAGYDLDLLVHESLEARGTVERLAQGVILHFRNIPLSQEFAKLNQYARLKALHGHRNGRTSNAAKMIYKPAIQFLKTYVGQRYALCRTPGLIHAVMQATYVFLTEAGLYRLSRPRSPDLS